METSVINTRRQFLSTAAALTASATVLPTAASAAEKGFELPPLPYSFDALAPVIDAQTMQIHHDKHHAGYVSKLNASLEGMMNLSSRSVEDLLTNLETLPAAVQKSVRNNGGGHANHSLFWKTMRPPTDDNTPTGKVAEAIESKFGSFANFQETFAGAATSVFGSGWAWLVSSPAGLDVISMPNQDSPIMAGQKPLLGLDVWEHAYYLKYQNRRPDYIDAWWKVVNWDEVAKQMA